MHTDRDPIVVNTWYRYALFMYVHVSLYLNWFSFQALLDLLSLISKILIDHLIGLWVSLAGVPFLWVTWTPGAPIRCVSNQSPTYGSPRGVSSMRGHHMDGVIFPLYVCLHSCLHSLLYIYLFIHSFIFFFIYLFLLILLSWLCLFHLFLSLHFSLLFVPVFKFISQLCHIVKIWQHYTKISKMTPL